MSVTEAAKRIGISASKVYQLVGARAISFYRVGGKIILHEADIDEYLASCRVPAAVPVAARARVQIKLKHLNLR